jgi:hypothetical protein
MKRRGAPVRCRRSGRRPSRAAGVLAWLLKQIESTLPVRAAVLSGELSPYLRRELSRRGAALRAR